VRIDEFPIGDTSSGLTDADGIAFLTFGLVDDEEVVTTRRGGDSTRYDWRGTHTIVIDKRKPPIVPAIPPPPLPAPALPKERSRILALHRTIGLLRGVGKSSFVALSKQLDTVPAHLSGKERLRLRLRETTPHLHNDRLVKHVLFPCSLAHETLTLTETPWGKSSIIGLPTQPFTYIHDSHRTLFSLWHEANTSLTPHLLHHSHMVLLAEHTTALAFTEKSDFATREVALTEGEIRILMQFLAKKGRI
jgi:hypothetical protein